MSYWIDFRIVSLSWVALWRIVSSRCLAWTSRYRNVKNPLTARVVMATHRMILNSMLLYHRTSSGTAPPVCIRGVVATGGSVPPGEGADHVSSGGGVRSVCSARHAPEKLRGPSLICMQYTL